MEAVRLVAGIDAGGTSLRIALSDASGQTTREQVFPSEPSGEPGDLAARWRAVSEGDGEAAQQVVAVAAGLAKVSRPGVEAAWHTALAALFPLARIQVVPDYVIAFRGAMPGGTDSGIACLAGTGSVAYGEWDGSATRVGGRGAEWGDEGSGGWLSHEAVRRVVRACDGLAPITPLARAVAEQFGVPPPGSSDADARRVVQAAQARVEAEGRGYLVPFLIAQAQNAGDAEAREFFVGAAGWLGALTIACARRLAVPADEPVTIARVGGLWNVGDLLAAPFARVVARALPHAVIVPAHAEPITGALRLAHGLAAASPRTLTPARAPRTLEPGNTGIYG